MKLDNTRFGRWMTVGALAGLLAFGAACDDDDDGVTPPPEPEPATLSAEIHDEPADPEAEPTFTGTLTGDAQVSVSTDGQNFTALGDPAPITLELQTSDRVTIHSDAELDEGTYTHARLTLTNVEVTLDEGSTFGETTLEEETPLTVGIEAEGETVGEVEADVELATPVTATEGTAAGTLVWHLDTGTWITEEAVTAGEVASADVVAVTTAELEAGAN